MTSTTSAASMAAAPKGARRLMPLFSRIAAAVFGGYAFCWGFIALVIATGYAGGLSFHDAEHLGSMLGMLVYLIAFCWAICARSLTRVWSVLLIGGAAMAGAASLVQRSMT